jgi:mono/diheme cytochrome c family protein
MKWLRRVGIVLVGLVLLLAVAFGVVYAVSSSRIGADHTATVHAFDAASGNVAEGRHLAETYGCVDCHGANLGGTLLVDGMPFARVAAPNLTAGRAAGALTDEQWELSVRHGIGPDGRALIIMPSSEYVYLSDQDLADLVAYVRTLPAVADTLPPRAFGPVGRTLITLGQLPFQTELMHDGAQHMPAPEKQPTAQFGLYLTRLCTGCHGANLAGAAPAQPGAPPGANLTPAGNLSGWSYEQFVETLRTGRTPEGKQLDPQFMPWTALGRATDTELRAIWEYLTSLEPVATPDDAVAGA